MMSGKEVIALDDETTIEPYDSFSFCHFFVSSETEQQPALEGEEIPIMEDYVSVSNDGVIQDELRAVTLGRHSPRIVQVFYSTETFFTLDMPMTPNDGRFVWIREKPEEDLT